MKRGDFWSCNLCTEQIFLFPLETRHALSLAEDLVLNRLHWCRGFSGLSVSRPRCRQGMPCLYKIFYFASVFFVFFINTYPAAKLINPTTNVPLSAGANDPFAQINEAVSPNSLNPRARSRYPTICHFF